LTNISRLGLETVPLPVFQLETWRAHLHLFGAVGLFKYTPAFFVSYLALAAGSIFLKGRHQTASQFSLLIITTKIFILGFLFTDNIDTTAGRNFITELPLWSYGYYLIWNYSKRLSLVIILYCLFRNFYHLEIILASWTSDWLIIDDVTYLSRRSFFSFEGMMTYWKGAWRFYQYRFGYLDFYILKTFIYISMTTGLVITALAQIQFKSFSKILLVSLFGLALIFFSLNTLHNKGNSKRLANEGFFKDSVVAKNEALHYDEYLDLLNKLELTNRILGKPTKEEIESLRASFLDEVKLNIINDPIGLIKDLEERKIRPSFWQLK
jgi:hypothetical protein